MKYLLFFIAFISAQFSVAQTLQGNVTDAETGNPMFPVTVLNTYTNQTTTTSQSGFYSITANTGDVIVFSYIGYKTIRRTKPQSVIVATLNVAMEATSNELHEFTFHSGKLTKYQRDSIERRTIYKTPLRRTHPPPLASPISALAELFSKKAKRTYEFQKIFYQDELNKFVETRYTAEIVGLMTGFTGDSIGYFMNTYPMPYDFARTASDLELKMWIRNNSRDWLHKLATGIKMDSLILVKDVDK